jgi:hypothetical protein
MMQRGHRLAAFAGLVVATLALAPVAQAGVIIDWGPNGNAYETNYTAATYISNPGSVMSFVGVVNSFAGQLAGFQPIPAGTEYTVYGFGFVSAGTTITPGGFANSYSTNYAGGTVEVWQDGSPDAAFGTNPPNGTVPSTFNDGSLFLRMTVPSVNVTFSKVNSTQQVLGGLLDSGTPNCTAVAGSALPLLTQNGQGCPLRLTGGWLARPGNFPAGYSAHYDGKIDIDCPTPATPATWGQIKSHYHE